ncbi:MAG TPA: hypothetical protein VHG08_18375, partial [Longimicrobium sp.]|nr:hypothetical protein [Longimicrobium sp.]
GAGPARALLRAGAAWSGVSAACAASARETLLHARRARWGRLPRRSRLNNDGSFLQVCVSLAPGGAGVRLLGDPGVHLAGAGRLDAACRALRAAGERGGAASLAALAESAARRFVDAQTAALESGPAWLACGLGTPGVALYLTARRANPAEGWARVEDWFRGLLPDAAGAHALVDALRAHAVPASVGIEGTSPDRARAKLYWRLRMPLPLAALDVGPEAEAAFAEFLRRTVDGGSIPRAGLVFSAGFSLADGARADVKVDVCAHCTPRAPEAWAGRIGELAAAFGTAALPMDDVARGRAAVAFVGLGMTRTGGARLNLYFKEAA